MTKTYKGTVAQSNNGSLNNDEEKKTTKAYHTLVICRSGDELTKVMLNDYRIFNDQGFNVSFNKDHKKIIINDDDTIYTRFYYSINGLSANLDGMEFDDLEVRFYRPKLKELAKLRESFKWLEGNFVMRSAMRPESKEIRNGR